MSLRDDLIAAMKVTAAQRPRAVKTKQWGTVYVRELTVADVDAEENEDTTKEIESAVVGKLVAAGIKDATKVRIARGAAKVIVDEKGANVFDHRNVDDVFLLAQQPWALLSKVVNEPEAAPGN